MLKHERSQENSTKIFTDPNTKAPIRGVCLAVLGMGLWWNLLEGTEESSLVLVQC